MAIADTYRNLLFEQFVAEQSETATTIDDVAIYIRDNLNTLDLTVPQFDASDYEVSLREYSSAAKFNNTFKAIRQDLRVLYKEMLRISKLSIDDFERWRIEADILERRLADLENKVENKLLLAKDTEGYHSFIFENFSKLENIDIDNTTAAIDVSGQQVFLDSGSNVSTSQIVFNTIAEPNLLESGDVSFKVRTSLGFKSRIDSATGSLLDIFTQGSSSWKTTVEMNEDKTVVCELSIQLSDDPISISSIYVELSQTSDNPMTITPLYSIDNYNFSQLPTAAYSKEITSKGNFNFASIEAKWIKFLLTKEASDSAGQLPGKGSGFTTFPYEFGFKDIFFYSEIYTENVGQDLITNELSITDVDGEAVSFSKIALETCEVLETNTDIKYYIAPGSSSSITVDSNTVWYPISPTSRESPRYPKVLDLGDLAEGELTDVGISYSADANPADDFTLVSKDTDNSILEEDITATATRFVFANRNERILDYQIKDIDYSGSGSGDALEIDTDSLVIFRNVGEQGLEISDSVRGVQRGWRFEDPYYITIVEILDPNGISMDVGDSPIIIDGVQYANEIGTDILLGKTSSFNGLHEIKVHKNNWVHVTPDLDTLVGTSGLIAADPLYPYNHKLLVEGYSYGDGFPDGEEKIYLGADVFFERKMKRVSPFDLSNNVLVDGYQYYALDRDAPTTHTGGNSSTRVFVVKIDETMSDFINERFTIRFDLINLRYSYLRLKAVLSTESGDRTPSLDSFKLKFGG